MNTNNPLSKAIQQANGGKKTGGLSKIARACGVTYQAVRRWLREQHFPRSEHVPEALGGTTYAKRIEEIEGVTVTADELRAWSAKAWQQTEKHS